MEIIEEGNKIYECETCGCKFKITSEDEIHRYDRRLNDDIRFNYCDTVKCPQCGETIIIKWY